MEDRRILIVDDNHNMCITLQDILEDEGYRVSVANSGEEALNVIEQGTPHLIISDIKMPNMDGLELLQRVKQRHAKVEIIIMTAVGEVNSYLQAMKDGAFEYITKPINPIILKTMLAKIFQQIVSPSIDKNN